MLASGKADSIRAFFALGLPASVRAELDRLVDGMRRQAWARPVRWVQSQNLHLTLRFLGDVSQHSLEDLTGRVGSAIEEREGFRLALEAIAPFPTWRRPRAVAVEMAPCGELESLAQAVESAVVAAGCAAEGRPFRGHVTLGRFRGRLPSAPAIAQTLDGLEMCVDEVVLYRSRLQLAGAVYSELAHLPLRRPEGRA